MKKSNTLFLFSDEHSRKVLGCYGNSIVKTPHMDRLAKEGTLFTDAYCNSPICVPARASLQTGRYVNEIGYWDNGHPYDGKVKGWGHHLIEKGHEVVSIGKLHFRDTQDPNGFSEEIIPLHVVEGIGDLFGMLRKEMPPRDCSGLSKNIGPGETPYIQYDRKITEEACAWLKKRTEQHNDKPWVLFVSLICPHFPLIAPEEFYNLYATTDFPIPNFSEPQDRPTHPDMQAMLRYMSYNDHFTEETRRIALASYYGLCSFVDHNIGLILQALQDTGVYEDTRIIYSSDHGDNLGTRGFWGKSTMYEESAGIPMLIAGADFPQGHRVSTPVSLVDLAPTLLEFAGEELTETEKQELPGMSLTRIANGEVPERSILSEYHAIGAPTGIFMIRVGKWKYVHYEGSPCQLFDLENDPEEAHDLGTHSDYEGVRKECDQKLRQILDPSEVTRRAFDDQENKVRAYGGSEKVKQRAIIPFTPAPAVE